MVTLTKISHCLNVQPEGSLDYSIYVVPATELPVIECYNIVVAIKVKDKPFQQLILMED